MTPWGQQRWAPLGAPPALSEGWAGGRFPVPAAPSSSRQQGGLVPKRGGARVAAVEQPGKTQGPACSGPSPGVRGQGERGGGGRGLPLGMPWEPRSGVGAQSPC